MPDTEVQEGQTGFEFHIADLPLIQTIEEVEAALNASGGREIAIAVPLRLITEPRYLPVDPMQSLKLMEQIKNAHGNQNSYNGIRDCLWTILLPNGRLVITNGFHRYDVISTITSGDNKDLYDERFKAELPIRVVRGTRLDVLRSRLVGAGDHPRIMPARFIKFISDADSWPFSGITFDQALSIGSYTQESFGVAFPGVDYDDVNSVVNFIFSNLNRNPVEVAEYTGIAMHIAPELFDRIVRKHANFQDGEIPMSVARSFIKFLPGQFDAQIRLCDKFRQSKKCSVTAAIEMIRSYDPLKFEEDDVLVEPARRLTPSVVVHHAPIGIGGGPRGSTEGLPDMIGGSSVTSVPEVAGGGIANLSGVDPKVLARAERIARDAERRVIGEGEREIIEQAMGFIDNAIENARDRIRVYANQNITTEAQRDVFFQLLDEHIASNIVMHLMRRAAGDYKDQSRIVLREAFSQESIDAVLGGIFERMELSGLEGDDIDTFLRQKLLVIAIRLEEAIPDIIRNIHKRCMSDLPKDVLRDIDSFGEYAVIMMILYASGKKLIDSRAILKQSMRKLEESRPREP